MERLELDLGASSFKLAPRSCLIDIETTGTSRHNHCIICIGVIYQENENQRLIQWIADNPLEEGALLASFLEWSLDFQKIYSYGGNRFDIPFIFYRLSYHGLGEEIFKKIHFIDLRRCSALNFKNKQLFEKAVNVKREVSVTGRDIVKLYAAYQKQALMQYKELILVHNKDELMVVLHGVQIYEIFRILAEESNMNLDYENTFAKYSLSLDFTTLHDWNLTRDNISIMWEINTKEVLVQIVPSYLQLKRYLYPIKDYYYIPSQQKLVHKSIATFIPKELKVKANKENCYIEKKDYFVRIYSEKRIVSPIWIDESHNKYVEYEEFIKNKELSKEIHYFL